jgi:hypothetical protein
MTELKKTYVKAIRIDTKGNTMTKGDLEQPDVCAFSLQDWKQMSETKGLNWKYIEHIPCPSEGDLLKEYVTGGAEITAVKEFIKNGGVLDLPKEPERIKSDAELVKELMARITELEKGKVSLEQKPDDYLNGLTDDQLKELAKDNNIAGFGNMKRETLISKLTK